MRLIAYRRVSTAGQIDAYGLPAQERAMRAYARAAGHKIVRVETDGGLSGTLPYDQRPGLLAAIAAIESRQADGILAPSLDRLARELTVQEAVLAQVWRAGGAVYVTDPAGEIPRDDPDDPMRTFCRQVMAAAAQLERAMISKRMRNGRKVKAAAGGYAHGSPAFGLRAADGQLVPDDSEREVIARIVAMSQAGAGTRAIATALNRDGVPSKRGGPWHPETVARVIRRQG